MIANKKNNYRLQPGCVSCKHVFERYEYDDGATCYCTLEAPPRPPCGSVCMHEQFSHGENLPEELRYTDQDPFSIGMRNWDEWEEGRQVVEFGICDKYELKPKKEVIGLIQLFDKEI
jgi:hypothetical protein